MCMSIKDFMSPTELENYNNNDIRQDSTGGMTRYKPNIDSDKNKNCKITDPQQEIVKEGAERIRKVLTVKELIDVLSAIENKDLEVYVRGSTWWIVPCNQVIEDGDSLVQTSAEIGDISLETVCNLLNEVWNEGE